MIERHRRAPYARTVALLSLWAGLAGAAELQISTAPQKPVDTPVEVRTNDGNILLTLDEAVTLALQRNLGIAVQRYTREAGREGIRQSLGIYDLGLSVNGSYSDIKNVTQSGFDVPEQKSTSLNLGLSQLVASGGTATLGWQNSKSEATRPSGFPPGTLFQGTFYQSNPMLTFKQPLLRNFGRGETEHGINVARLNSDISRQNFDLQLVTVVQQVENAYWDLRGAREQLVVAQEALDLAKELHQMNKVRVDVGTLAPLELVQSEVGIATAEQNIITAQAAVGNAADTLRRLINFPQGDDWNKEIVPETNPETEHPTIAVGDSISTALSARDELASQRLTEKISRLDAAYYRGQVLPQLDATASYGYRLGAVSSGDLFNNFTDLPGWSVGFVFGFPLQNRAARAQSTIASLNLERSQASTKDLELQVTLEVRTAVRSVETAAKTIDAARITRTLAEKNLDAERKRYENGMSTSFQVTQIQQNLTAARSSEVAAITGYRKALIEYYRSIGKLLDQSSVQVIDSGAPAPAATAAPAK
jgi:outer membrane protein TolC